MESTESTDSNQSIQSVPSNQSMTRLSVIGREDAFDHCTGKLTLKNIPPRKGRLVRIRRY